MALFELSLTKKQMTILRSLFDRLETEEFGKPGAVIMQCFRDGKSGTIGHAHGKYLSHKCAKKVDAIIVSHGEKKGRKKEDERTRVAC